MSSWIETKVRYNKPSDNGTVKTVTESYLIDAFSCTEAEERVTKEMQSLISGDFSVSVVAKSNITEIFYDETGDKWYKAKIVHISVNENSGEEKRTNVYIMIQAASFENALDNLLDGMKETVADYEILSIAETKIMDVYKYQNS